MLTHVLSVRLVKLPRDDRRENIRSNNLPLVGHRTKIIVTIDVVAPPRGKGNSRTTSTKDRKRQDEECHETSTVECPSNQVRVVFEDAWAVVSEVKLGEESSNDLTEDDASLGLVVWNVAGVLNKLWQVDLPK